MTEWTFQQWLTNGLVLLAIFAVVGGIVSQTSGGMSGRGFMEGMWKGVEWFFIAVVGVGVLFGVLWIMGLTSNALNTG